MKRLLLAATLTLVPLAAQAHTAEELRAWELEWKERAQVRLTPRLMAERVDMLSRHAQKSPQNASSAISANRAPSVGSGVEQWRPLVSSYGWDVNTALCLMAKESGGNPNARNPSSGASGLMQVLPSWAPKFGYDPADLFNPTVNLEISYALYVDGGWNHWSPYLRGECR